ncbi:hypothetical protein WJX74_004228 [Apatococcus lobatus]|uniref:Uncharacterized protein n=2 Tax=Apatococcus TaxID=904362 RepID=A0AAW1S843_9CHLO
MKAVTLLSLCVTACLALAIAVKLGSGIPSEEVLMQPAPDPSNLPWPAVKIGMALGRFVELLPNWVNPPGIQMLQLTAVSHFKATTIKALAELGIADLLANGPKTPQEMAAASGFPGNGDKLYRLLRLSTSSGVFAIHGPLKGSETRFRNNQMSILLRSDHPNTIKYMLMHLAADGDLAWAKLAEGVKTDKLPFELANGMGIWQYFKENPEREQVFSKAMATQDQLMTSTSIKEYDWSSYGHAIDIGGAYGSFIAALMRALPDIKATLFDMPQVADNAKVLWAKDHANLTDRVSFAGGDFFDAQTIPKPGQGKTAYIMRSILHDWDDSSSIKILKTLAAAMKGSQAKLVLIEQVLDDDFVSDLTVRHGFDLHMMAMANGKERTTSEWEALLGQAGFKLNKIFPTKGIQSLIETEPV